MFNNILAMVTQGVDLSLLQKQASHQSPESFCSLEKANDFDGLESLMLAKRLRLSQLSEFEIRIQEEKFKLEQEI